MHKLIDYLCDELEELERKAAKEGKLSMQELQYADTMAHLKKNLLKAEEMSEDKYSNRGYSRRGYAMRGSYGDGSYADGDSYADSYPRDFVRPDGSYARGRGAGAKRDAMGRYSRADMSDEIMKLMDKAPDEHTKEELRRIMDRL